MNVARRRRASTRTIQVPRPAAGCHVSPPSTETSTPPTTPGAPSVAVPWIVTGTDNETRGVVRREGDVRDRRRDVDRGRRRQQPGLQRRRLRAHVGEQVDGRLLHVHARRPCRRGRASASRPQDHWTCRRRRRALRSGACGGRGGGSPCPGRRSSRSPAGSARDVDDRGREPDQPRRAERRCRGPRPTRSRACRRARSRPVPGPSADDVRGVAPEAHLAVGRRDLDGVGLDSPLTVKIVPVSAFSGRPPSEGGEKRGSRQVPVHSGEGSILAPSCVSL